MSIFLVMENVPVNGADISHVQQMSVMEFSLTSIPSWHSSLHEDSFTFTVMLVHVRVI